MKFMWKIIMEDPKAFIVDFLTGLALFATIICFYILAAILA